MIQMRLSSAARVLDTGYSGHDVEFQGCSTDTRKLESGNLFIAIKGQNFDGNDFIEAAVNRGAVAALMGRQDQVNLPCIVVDNVRRAMGQLAQAWRQHFQIPLVAITGSNGKTTVKEMLGSILRLKAPVLSTVGNLNNDIGVPLTLYGLGNEHAYAIIEMGANHAGEISWLSKIAVPTVAVITQCAPAHLEGFGSIDGVARAKAEIFEGLDRKGTAIINADDDYAQYWTGKVRGLNYLSFGLEKPADITAVCSGGNKSSGSGRFRLITPAGSIDVALSLLGRHNVMNALAAAACAVCMDVDLETICRGLEEMKPVRGRLEMKQGIRNTTIIDDTYNANPGSFRAAINVLTHFPGKHWLVLGDMGELGNETELFHREAGRIAKSSGIEKLFTIGELGRFSTEEFGECAAHFESHDDLLHGLRDVIEDGVHILIKGSRSMHMEKIVQGLEDKAPC